jgi:hypothetical protein
LKIPLKLKCVSLPSLRRFPPEIPIVCFGLLAGGRDAH